MGGGVHIEYTAPSDGRLCWAEETTQTQFEAEVSDASPEAPIFYRSEL